MPQYFLPNHVFLCQAGTQVVFLDLRRSKYWAIDRLLASALDGVIFGWPIRRESRNTALIAEDAKILRSLLGKGLLTTERIYGKRANQIALEQVSEDLVSEYRPAAPIIKLRHVTAFLKAGAAAAIMLRCVPLHKVVERIRCAKGRDEPSTCQFDFDKARHLVEIYTALRPFLFAARDACLLDSLALFHYLRHFGLYATWVIGVQTDPFLAHSWLQRDRMLLNDSLVRVNLYTPIMAI